MNKNRIPKKISEIKVRTSFIEEIVINPGAIKTTLSQPADRLTERLPNALMATILSFMITIYNRGLFLSIDYNLQKRTFRLLGS